MQKIDRTQADKLQRDAVLPARGHLGGGSPGGLGVVGVGIEVRADRGDAVRVGGAQAEVHARDDVGVRAQRPVCGGGEAGAVEGAVGIGRALDGMRLVEVRVQVDEARPQLPAAEIDGRLAPARGAAGGRGDDRCDLSLGHVKFDGDQAIAVRQRGMCAAAEERHRHARIADHVGGCLGPAERPEGRYHRAPPVASFCVEKACKTLADVNHAGSVWRPHHATAGVHPPTFDVRPFPPRFTCGHRCCIASKRGVRGALKLLKV